VPRRRPVLLGPEDVAAALLTLPSWTGDAERISRTVRLAPADDAALRADVARVADEVDHHPVLEDLPDGATRYVLWTHVSGGVTALDLDLARRVDTLVDALPDASDRPDGG
jgi:4a-hydroxytetrahydrobiopterin dehydratase